MTRKKKIAIGITLLAVIVLLIFLWLLRTQPEEPQPDTVAPVQEESAPAAADEPTPSEREEQESRVTNGSLTAVAKTFAERFGSYSNEADFANVRDVLPLMTAEYRAEWEARLEASEAPEGFYTITTRVISVTVASRDDEEGTAVLVLSTQREEAEESPQDTRVFDQDLRLEFEKEQGAWRVSSAEWLEA